MTSHIRITFHSLWMLGLSIIASGLVLAQNQNPGVKPVNVTQPGDVALPLVSVGSSVGWKIGAEDYRINVPAAAAGRMTNLEVYSPEINRNDYANARDRVNYYGDELYGKNATLETTFQLNNREGQAIIKRSFKAGGTHSFTRLYQGGLAAGHYPLSISSLGNGKNSFQMRASSGVRVEASQFTVNARGQYNRDQLVAFLDVGKSAIGKTIRLENYDADGPSEMQLTLVSPKGSRQALTVSGDTTWAGNDVRITSDTVGTWKIQARILPTTKQFSNAVAFRFRLDGQPLFVRLPGFVAPPGEPLPVVPPPEPVIISVPPPMPMGNLQVVSIANHCGERVAIGPDVRVNGKSIAGSGMVPIQPREYVIEPTVLPGAVAQPVRVQVIANQDTVATLEYVVQSEVQLEPASLDLEVGQTATLTATASTKFESPVPMMLKFELPEGLEVMGSTQLTGQVSSQSPLVVKAQVRATKPITNARIRASLEPNCGVEAFSSVNVVQPAKLALEKTVDRKEVKPGDALKYTITVTNTGGATAQGVKLEDVLPAGLEGQQLSESFDLGAGEKRSFAVPATVTVKAAGDIINTAKLSWNAQPLEASATVRVMPTPETRQPELPEPAQLVIGKTVDRDTAKPGERVTFTITALNIGGTAAKGVRIQDVLPDGLQGPSLDETVDLEPDGSREFTVNAVVTRDANDELTNVATLTWQDVQLEASASVAVVVPVASTPPAPAPAKLTLEKTVDRLSARTGETVNFTMTVTNTGGTVARSVRLLDELPVGLQGSNITETFDLEPGAKRVFSLPTTVTAKSDVLVNTARVIWSADTLYASASVRVESAQPGTLAVNAVAVTCGARVPLEGANFTINGRSYTTPANIKLEPGEYQLEPVALNGSSATPIKVRVLESQSDTVTFEYTPTIKLKLEPEKLALKLGAEATIMATATTEFPVALPVKLALDLPDGLTASAIPTLEGTVSKDKPLVLRVPVRAVKLVQSEVRVRAPECNVNAVAPLEVTANPLPAEFRESELVVLAKLGVLPKDGYVVLSDRVPANAKYQAGSSRVFIEPQFAPTVQPSTGQWTPNPNQPGEPIADPFVSGDRLFWVIPLNRLPANALESGVIGVTYRVGHEGALEVPRDPAVLLVQPDARPIRGANTSNPFNPQTAIGKLVGLGEARVLEGDPGVLEAFAKAVPFGQGASVAAVATALGGPATTIKLTAVRVTTDLADQPELIVEAFDRDGKPANDAFATLEVTPEPATPDAQPEQPGYQVKLENGVGRVRLTSPSSAEGQSVGVPEIQAEARITNANGTVSSSTRFRVADLSVQASNPLEPTTANVTASARPLFTVGIGTVQLNLGWGAAPIFSANAALRFFARGTVFGDWLLTAAVNNQFEYDGANFTVGGDLLPPANPFERFPVLGDSSTTGSDARSSDGFYVRLERDQGYLMYGQITPGFQGLLSGYSPNFNGAQAVLRGTGYGVNGFVALVPNANRVFNVRGDGTSLYRLPNAPIEPGSERVVIVVYDRNNPSLKLETKVLVRLNDYTLDTVSGTIRLTRALEASNANGNPQFLEVEYATVADAAPRELRYGVQGSIGAGDGLSATATALNYRPGPNPLYLFSVGTAYRSSALQLGLEAAFSGPPGAGGGLGLAGQFSYSLENFQTQARYQELWPGYLDVNSGGLSSQPGRALQFSAVLKPSSTFSIQGSLAHNQNFTNGQADMALGLEGRNDFGAFRALLGLLGRFSNASVNANGLPINAGVFLTAGLEVPLGALTFTGVQRVPFTAGTNGETELRLDYAITPSFGIRLSDVLTYAPGGVRQELSLGARGSFTNAEILQVVTGRSSETPEAFGTTNIGASYDLIAASDTSARARVGLDTTIPLNKNWSAQLGGEALFTPPTTTGSLNLGLRYSDETIKGSTRAQFSFQPDGIKQVYTFGAVVQTSPTFVFSPSFEYTTQPKYEAQADGTSVRDGARFSLAAAWRLDDWSVLTNHTGRFGLYAPGGDEIKGEVQFGLVGAERWFWRAGAAYKLSQAVFTGQLAVGVTYYLTDQFGLGANAAWLLQSVTGGSSIAFGLEASYRFTGGLILSGGFNFVGFNGVGSWSTAPGFYVRLDFLFDESLFGGRR